MTIEIRGFAGYTGKRFAIAAFDSATGAAAPIRELVTGSLQKLTVSALSGTFRLTYGGQQTSAIPVHAGPAAVQAALEALSSVGSGNMVVTGLKDYRVKFQGTLGGVSQSLLTVATASLGGSLPAFTDTPGTSSATEITVGDAGFAKTGSSWVGQSAGGYSGWKAGDAVGANWAYYTVTGLSSGVYTLQMAAGNNAAAGSTPVRPSWLATTTRFHLWDGAPATGTYRGSIAVDQGAISDNFLLVPIGNAACTSGTLTLGVADDPEADGDVLASFLRVEPAYGSVFRGPNPTTWPLGHADRTISILCRPKRVDAIQPLLVYGDATGFGQERIYLDATGHVVYANPSLSVTGSTALSAGSLYMITVKLTGANGTGSVFVNTVSDATPSNLFTATTTNTTSVDSGLGIGVSGSGGGFSNKFFGTIYRVGVWSRITTGGEDTAIYNSGTPLHYADLTSGQKTGLVSWYDLDLSSPGTDKAGSINVFNYTPSYPSDSIGSPAVTASYLLHGGPPTFRVNGVARTIVADSEVWTAYGDDRDYERAHFISYRLSSPVTDGQTLELDIDEGAIRTTLGDTPALTAISIANHVGESPFGSLLPDGRTLKVGYNVSIPYFDNCLCPYSDVSKGGEGDYQFGSETYLTLAPNRDGIPTTAFIGNVRREVVSSSPDFPRAPGGYESTEFGYFTLIWRGTHSPHLNVTDARPGCTKTGATIGELTYENLMSDPKIRVYHFPSGTEIDGSGNVMVAPFIREYLEPTAAPKTLTFRQILQPGVLDDPEVIPEGGAPTFTPKFQAMVSGSALIRTMTWDKVNSGYGPTEYDDICQSTEMAYPGISRWRSRAKVHKIEPMLDSGHFLTLYPTSDGVNGPILKITTETPHNLREGWIAVHTSAAGVQNVYGIDLTLDNGQPGTVGLTGGTVFVLDEYTYVTTNNVNQYRPFDPVYPDDLWVGAQVGSPPIADACKMVEHCGAGAILWKNLCHSMSNACATAVGVELAAHMPAGSPLLIELSNECWNPLFSAQRTYLSLKGRELWPTATYDQRVMRYYVTRAEKLRYLIQQAWTGAGRTEAVNLVLNVWLTQVNWGEAALLIAENYDRDGRYKTDSGFLGPCLNQHGDGIAITPYYDQIPVGANLKAGIEDEHGVEEHEDLVDMNFYFPERSTWYRGHADHQSLLATTSHPNKDYLKLYGYEGGPAYQGIKDDGSSENDILNSMAATLHPRAKNQYLKLLKTCASFGLYRFAHFGLWNYFGGEISVSSGVVVPKNYGVFRGQTWVPGKGDGTDGKPNNLSAIIGGDGFAIQPNLVGRSSPIAQAVLDWNSGASTPSGTDPVVTQDPADRSVVEGQTATFAAAASGDPTPSVVWQYSTDGGSFWSGIIGATSTSYTTPATSLSDSGKKYRAIFTNSNNSATTAAATLTVTATPSGPTGPPRHLQPLRRVFGVRRRRSL